MTRPGTRCMETNAPLPCDAVVLQTSGMMRVLGAHWGWKWGFDEWLMVLNALEGFVGKSSPGGQQSRCEGVRTRPPQLGGR